VGTGVLVNQGIVTAAKRVMFVSDRMSYIVLRDHWCNIIVLNAHALTDERSDNTKHSFYEELVQVFDHFLKYATKILLGDFNAKLGREDIFKPKIKSESLRQDSNDSGVGVVRFSLINKITVKNMMFPHRNIRSYTRTSPDGKTHNQVDHILIERRSHSSVLDVDL
jgi:exonuclease III